MLDAIAGDDSAGPVTAMFAVDKYRRRKSFDQRQHFFDPFIRRSAKTFHWHVGVRYAARIRLDLFRPLCIVWHTQIDDGLDPEPLEICDRDGVGLSATVKPVVILPKLAIPSRFGKPR